MWDLQRFENNIAVIDELGPKITYGELKTQSDIIAQAVKGRCLVVVFCRNTIGSVLGYVSFIDNGIVPMMLNSHLNRELRDSILDKYSPKYLWMPKEMVGEFHGMVTVLEKYDYALVKTGYDMEYPLYEELALLLTTSGSTGSPKFVRQSYSNIKANTRSIIEYLDLNEGEKPITTLPMNYTYGLSIINTHIFVGATILLTDKSLMQKEFWEFFKENSATSFGGVPYTYEMLKRLRFMRMDLPSLKTMTQAGGKLTPELQLEFAQYAKDTGKELIVMYGQCEATARMGYLPNESALVKKGSMGIPIPGGQFCIIDESEELIDEPFVSGELVYKGENVTLGYAEKGADLIKGDERKGILHTGDMAMRDEDDFYYIVGRKKRFLKIYGNRVNLDETEQIIRGHFADSECVCAGVDDHLYIFMTDETKAELIKGFIAEKTGLNSSAFKTVVVESIPKNESGKVMYKELDKYYI